MPGGARGLVTTPALTGAKSLGLELFVTEVKANVSADLSVPQAVKDTPPVPSFTLMTTKMGDGLYWIAGQNDCSLVVEFKDFITVVEGPMNDDRSGKFPRVSRFAAGKRIRQGSERRKLNPGFGPILIRLDLHNPASRLRTIGG